MRQHFQIVDILQLKANLEFLSRYFDILMHVATEWTLTLSTIHTVFRKKSKYIKNILKMLSYTN